MDEIKVLIVSSVVPSESSGGEMILHRHLKLNPEIQCELVHWQWFPFRLKLIGKIRQLGYQSFARSWECLFPVLPSRDWCTSSSSVSNLTLFSRLLMAGGIYRPEELQRSLISRWSLFSKTGGRTFQMFQLRSVRGLSNNFAGRVRRAPLRSA